MAKTLPKLTPLEIIQGLDKAKTNKAKQKIIRNAWISDSEEFFIGLQYSVDSNIQFRHTITPLIDDEDEIAGEFTFRQFIDLCNKISSSHITESDANDAVKQAALKANVFEWNLWYRRILLKTLSKYLPMDIIRVCLTALTKT